MEVRRAAARFPGVMRMPNIIIHIICMAIFFMPSMQCSSRVRTAKFESLRGNWSASDLVDALWLGFSGTGKVSCCEQFSHRSGGVP
jgi:hypothetical protein